MSRRVKIAHVLIAKVKKRKTSGDGGERRKRCGKTEVFEDDDVMIILRYTRAFLPPFFIFLRRSVDGKN